MFFNLLKIRVIRIGGVIISRQFYSDAPKCCQNLVPKWFTAALLPDMTTFFNQFEQSMAQDQIV